MPDLRNFTFRNLDDRIAYLEHLANQELAKQKYIQEYRDYYDGDHEVKLTKRQEEFLNNSATDFRFNICPVVVEALVERLELSGFEPVEEETEGDGLVDFASQLWEQNRMDAGQEELYRQAAIDGMTYLILDVNSEGLITLNHNDAYVSLDAAGEGEGVKLHYATAQKRGRPIFATKRWAVTRGPDAGYRRYYVEYWADEIRRYYQDDRDEQRTGEAMWREDIATEGPLANVWPIPWLDANGLSLGLPVVEFRNGRSSELAEVVPLQKGLNKAYVDLVAAADNAGFGVMFASGWVPTSDGKPITVDDDGNVTSGNEPLPKEPGVIYYTLNPDGNLIRVPGDDLNKLIQVIDRNVIAVAQVTRTPITNFQLFGQIPSDATQKELDKGLIAKTISRQRVYGNAWEDVIYKAARIASAVPRFDGGRIVGHGLEAYQVPDNGRIQALWQDAIRQEGRALLEELTLKKNLGVPDEQLFLEMGYDQEQAERFAVEQEAQRTANAGLRFEPLQAVTENGRQNQA